VTLMALSPPDLRLILGATLFAVIASTVPALVLLIGSEVDATATAAAEDRVYPPPMGDDPPGGPLGAADQR